MKVQDDFNAYLHSASAFDGKPQRLRNVFADYNGQTSELLAKAAAGGRLTLWFEVWKGAGKASRWTLAADPDRAAVAGRSPLASLYAALQFRGVSPAMPSYA